MLWLGLGLLAASLVLEFFARKKEKDHEKKDHGKKDHKEKDER